MEDDQIVSLYWDRNEHAIRETDRKYGKFCYKIAYNILGDHQDSEESVNDTYIGAWEAIPPHRPAVLQSFLAKLTRRISLNRWRSRYAAKRGGGEVPLALEELTECVQGGRDPQAELEYREIARVIKEFVSGLGDTERDVFLSRYWYLASIEQIGRNFGFTAGKVKSMLMRTRGKLRAYLRKEGMV